MTPRISLLVFLCFGALLAACGGDATSDDAAVDDTALDETALDQTAVEGAAVDGTAEGETAGGETADESPTTADLEPSPAIAATITFGDGTETEIDGATLDEFFATIAEDPDFVLGAFGSTGMPAEFQQSLLGDLVIGGIIDQALAERGLERSEAAIAQSRLDLEGLVASFLPPQATVSARFETLPYLDHLVALESGLTTLGEALVDELPPGEAVEVPCSSHILLASEDEALEVIGLLDDGGDFAELAMEFSTGPSGPAGGVLGCADPNGFVPEFRDAILDAPVGTIIGPVETQFGFHVITVTEIEEQTVGAPTATELATQLLTSELATIEVEIAPELGAWDPVTGQVLPLG